MEIRPLLDVRGRDLNLLNAQANLEKEQGSKKVLYLEDTTADIIVFERLIKNKDISVLSFLTMKDLTRFFKSQERKPWDLIVVDYTSDFFSYIDTIQELAGAENVLVTSGSAERYEHQGKFPFVHKGNLERAVRGILEF